MLNLFFFLVDSVFFVYMVDWFFFLYICGLYLECFYGVFCFNVDSYEYRKVRNFGIC